MTASIVYRSPVLYDLAMRLLYGKHHEARYRAVADLVPAGASVLDVCCGPGFLFERFLRQKDVHYTGLDLNPRFAERVERLGGRGLVVDLARDEPLPPGDYIIMQASLYQFLPDAARIVRRLLDAARDAVIVAEPVKNLATSQIPVVRALARRSTNAGLGPRPLRFDEPALDALIGGLAARSFLIPGGREKVFVIAPTARSRSAG